MSGPRLDRSIARDPAFQARFLEAGVALPDDDVRSHLGATVPDTALIELFRSQEIKIEGMYQLNVRGNADFLS
ncbi:hypothetical protein [Thermogemmatispora sp.]|uniref:hypothetical protein n=1 Tax=Thermogemmatispora sp. TaxID=1968838 RepID=UPI0035E44ABC